MPGRRRTNFTNSRVFVNVGITALSTLLLLMLVISSPYAQEDKSNDEFGPPGINLVPPPLNEKCIVAILNRVAQVRPDGTWTVQNVPTNFGMVRARATCVSNSTTWGAESDLFTVPPNGIVAVGELKFEALTPIPTALRVTAPSTTLTAAGATVQLSVIATLSDGSTRDATAASAGTNYTISNSAVATVSPSGVVTAVSSGTVIVSVTHEGVLGLIRLQTALSGGDTDRDGIPDDIEQANGLNPNDPVDGFLDADGDGLTNKQELIDFGTNFQVTDTDGDTIADGEEVQAGADGFVTNPLLADTDGDGSNDAAEIASGSDPTDPTSRPGVVTLTVTPTNLTLTVNTIIGEASQKLTVTGRRADGSTVNLTADPGTNYTSSDLTICNFGAEKGRVFASNNGTCTITITNGGLSAQASVVVQTFAPRALSFVSIPGFANNVDVSGDYAYVAAGATGLQVVDVSNRSNPRVVAALDTSGNANDVKVVGTTAYIADGSAGLRIIDITNPLAPVLRGTLDTAGIAQDVVIKDRLAYVADGAAGLRIIDVSNPTAPSLRGSVDTPGTAKGVDVALDRPLAVIADGTGGIRVVDVTNPAAPTIVGSVSTGTGGDARDVVVQGNFAFVADFSRSFTVVDFSTPTMPVVRASTPSSTGGLLMDVTTQGRFAFGADVFFVNGVPIIDVSVPQTPTPRAILNFSSFRDDNGTGIAADSAFVYLTAQAQPSGITENGTTADTRLYIGQYLALEDTAGIPPAVQITAPAPGAAVAEGDMLPITVAATDDVAVAGVNFIVNGQVVFIDTTAPYQFNLVVAVGAATLTLGATATDSGGNVGVAADVVVNVSLDPPPTVTLTSPAEGAMIVEGETITLSADATDNVAVVSVQFTVNGADVALDTSAPFSTQFVVPVGSTTLTVAATATDNLGKTTTATRSISVTPDPPPTVMLTSPAEGATVVEGETVTLSADATDNVGVVSVQFTVNGTNVALDTTPPFSTRFVVPVGVTTLTVAATAADNLG
ncbi:MAG: Ig-like domain-containing protein, partial [bacterium]